MGPETSARISAEEGALCVCVLGSGSRGNSTYVSDGVTSILVDAGLSARETERRLASRGLSVADLSAILITHEHGDHVRGVARLARRHRLPVYLSPGTHGADGPFRNLPSPCFFSCGRPFLIHTLAIHPFSIPHDAGDPCGFTIGANGSRIGIATDLGQVTALVAEHLRGCRVLVLEANHDPQMLHDGPYPWFLKQRIRGRTGHLSNEDSGRLLTEIRGAGLAHVVLAHLSETNNTPEKALAETARALDGTGIRLTAATQGTPTALIRV
jgi:phosphoribosyl 1,2-cyclic phosphodiesterase